MSTEAKRPETVLSHPLPTGPAAEDADGSVTRIRPASGWLFVNVGELWRFRELLFFLVIVLAALGVGTLLAALNVSYRDFRYVVPFLVQVWMFATPTVYMALGRGGVLAPLLALNPMTSLIANFRAACLGGAIEW